MNFRLKMIFKEKATQEISYVAGLCKTSPEAAPRAVELVLEYALTKFLKQKFCNIFSGSSLSLDSEGQYELVTSIDPSTKIYLEDSFATNECDSNFDKCFGKLVMNALIDQYNFDATSSVAVQTIPDCNPS